MVGTKGKSGKYKRTKKHSKNISKSLKGHKISNETKRKIGTSNSKPHYFNCDYCDKKSISKESAFKRKRRHFCSQRCYNNFRSEIMPSYEQNGWKGGISFEPYCIKFDDEFKERVREYWGRECILCTKSEKENNRKLSVHHVTYNKDTCCDNSIPLFIALCNSCHAKTQSNREYWENTFKKIIYSKNKYGKCFYSKEEMKAIQKL